MLHAQTAAWLKAMILQYTISQVGFSYLTITFPAAVLVEASVYNSHDSI